VWIIEGVRVKIWREEVLTWTGHEVVGGCGGQWSEWGR